MITAAYVRGIYSEIDLRALLGEPQNAAFIFARGGAPVSVTAAQVEVITAYATASRCTFTFDQRSEVVSLALALPFPDDGTIPVVPGTAQPARVQRPAPTPEVESPAPDPGDERKE